MENKFPFTSYDFYAYLTSGAIFLAGMNFALKLSVFSPVEELNFIEVAGLVAASYILGHVIAQLSSIFIEGLITHKLFGNPFEHLIVKGKENKLSDAFAKVFNIRELKEIKGKDKISGDKSANEWAKAFNKSLDSESSRERLSNFLNLYGLCRNMCFVFLIVSVVGMLNIKELNCDRLILFCLSFVLSFFMFVRYLKFYAAHSKEVVRRV